MFNNTLTPLKSPLLLSVMLGITLSLGACSSPSSEITEESAATDEAVTDATGSADTLETKFVTIATGVLLVLIISSVLH